MKKKSIVFLTVTMSSIFLFGCSNVHFKTFKGYDENNSTNITIEDNKKNKVEGTEEQEDDIAANQKQDIADEEANELTSMSADNSEEHTSESSNSIKPVQNKELRIYSINIDSSEIEAVTALVPMDTELTPQFVVDTVIETLADIGLNVGYNSVKAEKDTIYVDFRSDMAPITNVGAGFESAILDAIAQSLLDNLDQYSKVVYRMDGTAYSSGHIVLDINEVYLEE